MDRKKPPALTSPWKVGFLVALMLVLTGLGVSYFITGTFGVKWHWITVNGLSPMEWVFNFSAFASEMLPLIGLIATLAFATSVLVSGAVRRYKAYVDSGADYRDLLRSIKSIEDLEDESTLDQLKQHPDLRECLMSLKHKVAARERQQTERERKPYGESGQAPARVESLASEAGKLLGAITGDKGSLDTELSLTIPELKQLERAVRQRLAESKPSPAPAATPSPARDEKAEAQRRELESRLGSLRGAVGAVRRDAEACSTGAHEVEAAIAALKQSVVPDAAPVGDMTALAKRIEALATTLATLGEETKRIAIASALQASGGSDDDTIRVADEVRAIATKFNTVSQQWKDCVPELKRTFESASGSAASSERQRAAASKGVAAAVSKASLWGERLVVLAEQVRRLEQLAGTTDGARVAEAPAPDTNVREWGNVDIGSSPPPSTRKPERARVEPETQDEEFLTQSPASVFAEESGDDAPFVDIPGFEKEARIFGDGAGQSEAEADESGDEDGRFLVDGTDTEGWGFMPPGQAANASEPAAPAPAREQAAEDGEGFLTGPRAAIKGKKSSRRESAPADAGEAAAPGRAATAEADGVLDLYALGAVDYDELLHA